MLARFLNWAFKILCKLTQVYSKLTLFHFPILCLFRSEWASHCWIYHVQFVSCIIYLKFWSSFNTQFKFYFFEALFTPSSEPLNYLPVPLALVQYLFLFMGAFLVYFSVTGFSSSQADTCYYLVSAICPYRHSRKILMDEKNQIIRTAMKQSILHMEINALLNFHITKQWSL